MPKDSAGDRITEFRAACPVPHPIDLLIGGARRLLAALAILFAVAGCGTDRPSTVDASGWVTYQGAPVEGARVMFHCEAGRPATGTTDAEGRFVLMTFEAGDGAIPGQHKVTVTKRVEVDDPNQPDSPYKMVREMLPARFGNPEQSGLTASVEPDGDNEFRFDLTD